MDSSIELHTKWKKENVVMTFHDKKTVLEVKHYLYEETNVRPENQKLLGLKCRAEGKQGA